MGEVVAQRRPVWAGVVTLLAVVAVLGVPTIRLWAVSQLPPLALLEGIRLPGPLPTLGLPLADDPSWAHWAMRSLGALAIPLVFGLWMSRSPRGPGRVALGAWTTTVVAVVFGSVVHAVLASMLLAGGFLSFLLTLGGTLLVGTVIGMVVGVVVAVACAIVSRRSPHGVGSQ